MPAKTVKAKRNFANITVKDFTAGIVKGVVFANITTKDQNVKNVEVETFANITNSDFTARIAKALVFASMDVESINAKIVQRGTASTGGENIRAKFASL